MFSLRAAVQSSPKKPRFRSGVDGAACASKEAIVIAL